MRSLVCMFVSIGFCIPVLSQDLFEDLWTQPSSGAEPDISSDGQHILTTSLDSQVLLQELATGNVLGFFEGIQGEFSFGGSRFLVIVDTDTVSVYDTSTQSKIRQFDFEPNELMDAALTNDGETVFVVLREPVDGDPEHWMYALDVVSGLETWRRFLGFWGQDINLDIARDGQKVAVHLDNHPVQVLETATGAPVFQPLSVSNSNSVYFTADSSSIVVGTQTHYMWYESTTGAFQRSFSRPNSRYFAAAVEKPHAVLYSSSYQADVYLFLNSNTWNQIGTFVGFTVQGKCPDFSNDGKYFVYPSGPSWGGEVYVVLNPAATVVARPSSMQIIRATHVSGTLESIRQFDNNRLVLRPGVVFSTQQAPVQLVVEATLPQTTSGDLRFISEAVGWTTTIEQKIELYNFNLQQYVVCDVRQSFGDQPLRIVVPGSDYIETGTRNVKARVSYRPGGPVLSYPWKVDINYFSWRIDN